MAKSTKIKTLKELKEISSQLKKEGKIVAFISGCFDILHIGHIKLFKFARKRADCLIIGLDSDKSIKLSKGENRPIHNFKKRGEVLSELESVNYIFLLKNTFDFGSEKSDKYYNSLVNILKPNYLVTTPIADKFWRKKESRARKYGSKLLKYPWKLNSSSTSIIDKLLEKEF